MLLINSVRGDIIQVDDPTAYVQQGYREPTADELEHTARTEEFGDFASQAQAQVERVVRGATLGAVEGFGSPEDIQARADVSRELSPITSFAADVAPDVGIAALTGGFGGLATGAGRAAGRAALAEGSGLIRAGLAAARAGGAAALAGESVGTGLVSAGQSAFSEGRDFEDDPGKFAEDTLLWGGLNLGLGALMHGSGAGRKAVGTVEPESLDDIAKAAEFRAKPELPEASTPGTPGQIHDVEGAPVANASRAPLEDVELPGPDGMLDTAAPDDPRLQQIAPELDRLRSEGISGKSLNDLRALPLEDPATADPAWRQSAIESEAKVQAFAADETFAREGMLPSNNDRGRGGLPSLGIEGDVIYLNNGRHRLTAARRSGQEEIVMNVKAYDAEGNTLWDYVGPVRVNPSKAERAAARVGEREAADGGVERALRGASKSDADDLVEQAVRSPVPAAEADSFGRQRRLYINRKAIQDVAAREMQQDLSGLVKDVSEVTRVDKLASISAHVADNLPAQRAVANGVAKDAAEFAGQIKAEAKAYAADSGKKGEQYAIPGQKGLVLALMDNAKLIQQAKSGKALFEAIDGFKRTAQDYKVSLETGAANSVNPIHHQQLIPKIDAFAQKLRSTLEDSNTWGQAGEMQSAYNAVIHDRLVPSWKVFEESTLKRTHKGYDGMWQVEGWESKIASLLKNTDPGARRHVGTVLDAMDELASVRRKYGDAKVATRIEDATAKVRRTIGLADEVTDATERMTALGEMVSGVPMGGAIAGGLAGGLPGAAIGAALPGAVRGFVLGDLVSAYQRLSGATDAALGRGVDDWIRSSRLRGSGLKLPRVLRPSEETSQLGEIAARRGISHGMALFQGDEKSPAAAFEKWRDALLDEPKFFEKLGQDYQALAQEDPATFMALSARAGVLRQFLVLRMPPNVAVSMANQDGYPPSRESIEDWSGYVNAATFPKLVLRNLGAITQPQIETLKVGYPRLHERLQQTLIERIGTAMASGERLDDTFLMRANLLFPDLDGLGSPVFGKEFGKVVREYTASKKQPGGGSGGPSRLKQIGSPLENVMTHGATLGTQG
jgi:hypothetical protein